VENVLRKPTASAGRPREGAHGRPYRPSLISRFNQRSIRFARSTQAWLQDHAGSPIGSFAASASDATRPLRSVERALPIGVAALVAVATLLAVLPSTPLGSVGGTTGSGDGPRLAIAGQPWQAEPIDGAANYGRDYGSFTPLVLDTDVTTDAHEASATVEPGNFLDDGTLLTGYAPDTEVADGSDLIQRYKVKSGDTLSAIANRYGVSMMTLWWANKLKNKDDLHVGQVLRIPPVSGLVVTVGSADTLESLAAKHKVKPARILELNDLQDPTLVVGQVLVLPGAKGAPIPTPKPTPKPQVRHTTGGSGGASSGGGGSSGPVHYTGGRFRWPVVGGHNYISQYAHAGHMAIDIAADYGTTVVAASGGRVVFAGWKSNGGGWQVWISHGSGMYTTYNHMSGVSVSGGQSVGKGQRVGRIGSSGWATGPHLHFEVWLGGTPWAGGHQVNPMRYF
jgi:murein DD-endopeptidase MepM/ murein hydrolase activator NlpD